MKQFNLSEWLQDKSRKVVTRDGRPARIVCWDAKVDIRQEDYHIIVLIDNGSHGEEISYFNEKGIEFFKTEEIFFADKEDGLTEFEKELKAMIQDVENSDFTNESFTFWKGRLFDLVRKEVEQKAINHTYAYQNGYENGKYDALKDLPKWEYFATIPDYSKSGTYLALLDGFLYNIITHKRIGLNQLEKLPKEE